MTAFIPTPATSAVAAPPGAPGAYGAPGASAAPAVLPRAAGSSGFVPQTSGHRIEPAAAAEVPEALAPLRAVLADPSVTDVLINSDSGVFVDRGRGPERDRSWRFDENEVRALAVAVVAAGGRHIDEAHPCVDVRLPGIRAHAVLPPVSTIGTLLSLRVASRSRPRLDDLAQRGMFGHDPRMLAWLRALVDGRMNVLITGGTGTGKTTLLAALLSEVGPRERIVTVEDVAELSPAHPHHVALEARQPNLEGAGGISLARLVREALRMRPDRLVVGECRGEEVREMLAALNTGHDGGAGTLHASGLLDVPARLEALGALAGLDDRALARQVVSAIGAVVHLGRSDDGERRVLSAGRFELADDGRLRIVRERPWAPGAVRGGERA